MGKYCSNCGTELKENADVCLSCGQLINTNTNATIFFLFIFFCSGSIQKSFIFYFSHILLFMLYQFLIIFAIQFLLFVINQIFLRLGTSHLPN